MIAEVTVSGSMKQASNKGFKMIAGYIFGGNTSQQGDAEKISMTTPVTMEPSGSEKISMTTPVTMQQSDSQWRMRDEPFEPREPGETIWHEPYVPHATNVGHQPLLCVYMWTRDVQHAAMLV